MTTYNKTTLKTFFEQGDTPTGTDYANLIDSCVNMVETAVQNMAGPLSVTELIAPLVSAGTITGNIAATTLDLSGAATIGGFLQVNDGADFTGQVNVDNSLYVSNILNALAVSAPTISTTTLNVSATGTINATGIMATVSAIRQAVGIVSAAGTAQGTAAALVYSMNRLQGVNDGSTTGCALPANQSGRTITVINETAASANLWPPTGGTINALGANAAFGLTANTMYTVLCKTASAYAVK